MKHVYVSDKSSGFKFTVVLEDEKGKESRVPVVFEKGQFKTDDDNLAAGIDELIATKLQIRQRVRKTDKAAAEALAKQHMAAMQKTGAVKGGVTSVAMQQAMNSHMLQRDQELMQAKVDRTEFAEQDLVLTEEAPAAAVAQPVKSEKKSSLNLKK